MGRTQPSSRMCFVCGRENPVGLQLEFYEEPNSQRVVARFSVPAVYQGYPGIVHGGVVAAILDEVAGRAVLQGGADDRLMATLRLTVRYRQPTPTETNLSAVGWVERTSGMGVRVAGELRLADGTVTADCEAVLVEAPPAMRAGWEADRAFWKVYRQTHDGA